MNFTEKETRVLRIAIEQYIEGLKECIFYLENPTDEKEDKKDLATAKRIIKKLRSCND